MKLVNTLLSRASSVAAAPVRAHVASICILLLAAPASYGQQAARSDRNPRLAPETGVLSRLTNKYRSGYVPPVDLTNSSRLEQLIRAGNLYLTLNDTIALALENNINLESQRYQFQLADVAYKTSLTGPNGNWDPTLTSNQFNWGHSAQQGTSTQTNGGVDVNTSDSRTRNFSLAQSFQTGGQASIGFNNSFTPTTNSTTATFVPLISSGLSFTATQPLLNGFGFAYNRRNIYIAKNNQRAADANFQTNINSTLSSVIQAYWNLLTATLNVAVVQTSLAQAEKLSADNRTQVQIGTLAVNDVVNSDANVATAQGNLVTAQTAVLTQEASLKNLLSRNGIASATLAAVHIVPIDRVRVPEVESVQPIQDLIQMALEKRPELTSQRIGLENNEINIKAAKNQLLPTVNLTGTVSNPAVGGTPGFTTTTDKVTGVTTIVQRTPPPDLIGGYSNILRQLFYIPTVNYTIGFTLNIPLRNRNAQYALETQQLNYRQSEVALQQQINQIRLDVQNAQINIDSARARYAIAVTQTALNQQVLDNETKKLALGASTTYQVIQYQTQLLTSRQNELSAQVSYANAKLAMDVATSNLMDKYNIVYDDAKAGQLSRRPDPIPDVINQPRP